MITTMMYHHPSRHAVVRSEQPAPEADAPSYMPGGGGWWVGDRVRYVGKNSPGTSPRRRYVEDLRIGVTGTIIRDFGFDYRYLIRLDTVEVLLADSADQCWRADEGERRHHLGMLMRTGGYGWERTGK